MAEGKLTGNMENDRPKEKGRQIKPREEAIVRRGEWASACGLSEHLSLEGMAMKEAGGEVNIDGGGFHLSLWQAKGMPPKLIMKTKVNLTLGEIIEQGKVAEVMS